ncbi:MAG TPA: chemotaxis protein CheB [Blastocatellia bacterium]|jgi:two-component system chemotaxis response regulator CheB
MQGHDIIVVGASAGGVKALKELARGLPPDLPAAVFIVLHIPSAGPSLLPKILNSSGPLRARQAINGEVIEHGRIYIAPPDHHLLVNRDHVRIVRGPKENRMRPAADALFRSAAHAYGTRVVGVVLSGSLDDGTAGLAAIKRRGGLTVAQAPEDALYSGMPRSASENVALDHCLPLAGIAPLLARLASTPVKDDAIYPMSEILKVETGIRRMEDSEMEGVEKIGELSAFTCPLWGALWELRDGDLLRFCYHVGRAFSAESPMADQAEALENALWAALRSLEQDAASARRMAARARERNHTISMTQFEENARQMEQHAAVIRKALQNSEKPPVDER